jgi:hypothetical protein
VPPPRVLVAGVQLQGEWLEFDVVGGTRAIALPDELYLGGLRLPQTEGRLDVSQVRLLDLDLADAGAIENFSAEYGQLVDFAWRSLPDSLRAAIRPGRRRKIALHVHPGLAPVCKQVEQRLASSRVTAYSDFHLEHRFFVHVDEFRLYAALLRDAVRLRQFIIGDLGLSDMQRQWENVALPAPSDAQTACAMLADLANAALAGAHVRIGFVEAKPEENEGDSWPAQPVTTRDLNRALWTQFANHVAEQAKYMHCQAAGCNRIYIRKQGGARANQQWLKGDRMYCSAACTFIRRPSVGGSPKASFASSRAPRAVTTGFP